MAFGKDNAQADKIVPFGGSAAQRTAHRQQVQQETRNNSKKPRGSAPYWKDTFKPPQDYPRWGRLIPGQYTIQYVQRSQDGTSRLIEETSDYYVYAEHYHGGLGKGCICSAGPHYADSALRNPCPSCDTFWEGVRARREDSNYRPAMSRREMNVFNWWDYGLWIKEPQVGADGRYRMNNSTNQPYYDWVPSFEGDPRLQQREYKYGHLLAWPMSNEHREVLFAYQKNKVRHSCGTCGTQGVRSVGARCPRCKNTVQSFESGALSPTQQEDLFNAPITCPHCSTVVYLEDVVYCPTCYQNNWSAQRANIFSVDIQVIGQKSGNQKGLILQVLESSQPRPIQVDAQTAASIKPLPLSLKFAPTPPKEQERIYNVSQQQQPAAPSYQGVPYQQGQQPQQPAWQAPPVTTYAFGGSQAPSAPAYATPFGDDDVPF